MRICLAGFLLACAFHQPVLILVGVLIATKVSDLKDEIAEEVKGQLHD